ncbi:MAG TPA: hypothetical protein VGE02_11470 [Gemmatimonadales bacterium]
MQPCHRPRSRLRLAAALLVVAASVVACFRDADEAVWARGEAVGRLVVERLTENEKLRQVDLAQLAPFRWDRLYVFGPYTPARVVTDSLGHPWPGAEASRIAQVDTANLIVFTAGDEVIAATMHPRRYGDFTSELLGRGYAPSEAVFTVERSAEGTPVFGR